MGEGVQARDGRTLTCSRIGCDAVAVASFSFDALNELAWLDTVVEARGAGFLCQLHAERLTPPRGWSLLDRRSPEPKLFVAPAVLPDAAAPAAGRAQKKKRTTRARHPKNTPAADVETAVSPGPSAAPTPAADAPAVPARPAAPAPAAVEGEAELPFDNPPPMPTTWSARNLPALDEDVDDRTPLLARAFESLRQHEERRPEERRPGSEGPAGA